MTNFEIAAGLNVISNFFRMAEAEADPDADNLEIRTYREFRKTLSFAALVFMQRASEDAARQLDGGDGNAD